MIFQSYSFVICDTKVLYILFAFQLVKRVVNSVLFFRSIIMFIFIADSIIMKHILLIFRDTLLILQHFFHFV